MLGSSLKISNALTVEPSLLNVLMSFVKPVQSYWLFPMLTNHATASSTSQQARRLLFGSLVVQERI